MKNSIRTLVAMSTLTLGACGASTSLTGTSGASSTTTLSEITIQDSSKNVIADITGVGQDEANVWMPTQGFYTQVTLSTGAYASSYLYYSGVGCTGSPAVSVFIGSVNKSIVYGNSTYYKVTAEVASFSYQSYLIGAVCTNLTSTLTNAGTLTVTTQPYNFAALAPITLNF